MITINTYLHDKIRLMIADRMLSASCVYSDKV